MIKAIKLILVTLLLISVGFNIYLVEKKEDQLTILFSRYEEEMKRVEGALKTSLETEEQNRKLQYMVAAFSGLENAEQVAVFLGYIDRKYSTKNNVDVYQAIPYEIKSILAQAYYSGNETELKQIQHILKIYNKYINKVNLKDPNKFRDVYFTIHREIQDKGLKKDIHFPSGLVH
ncbi:MAG: hypothetical protein H0Z33_08490 [Bacillaceae bacterium]|nr:hypothetical protein [Bacillaceae bacterium]